jgi:alkylated DNA repair dioxygenase AlkB
MQAYLIARGKQSPAAKAVQQPKDASVPTKVAKEDEEPMQSTAPAGLIVIEDFISAEEEQYFMQQVDVGAWEQTLKRRVQHYGHRYDYATRSVADPSAPVEPLPVWAVALAQKIETALDAPFPADQLIVNEYAPGQGIARHIDAPIFAQPIVSVSLGSPCIMTFRGPAGTGTVHHQLLPRRSMVALSGDARSLWTHEIAARKSDVIQGGSKIERQRRVSLTFRIMRK